MHSSFNLAFEHQRIHDFTGIVGSVNSFYFSFFIKNDQLRSITVCKMSDDFLYISAGFGGPVAGVIAFVGFTNQIV